MDAHKIDLPHNHSSSRFTYLTNKHAFFKKKSFMLWLLSRCSLSELLGSQDHKNYEVWRASRILLCSSPAAQRGLFPPCRMV